MSFIREPGLRLFQPPLLGDLEGNVGNAGYGPVGVQLDQRTGQHLGLRAVAMAPDVDDDAMAVAYGAAFGGKTVEQVTQFRRRTFQHGEQVAGIADTRQRHQMLHGVGIDHPDRSRRVDLHQPGRRGVKKFQEFLFLAYGLCHRVTSR
jgi:hypothetical protein